MEDNNKDRRELLIVKQNPEAYRDNVFRDAKEKYAKQRTKLDDFLYYAKWLIIIGGIAAVLLVFLILQTTSREAEDIRIALVSYDHPFGEYNETLSSLLEKYTPDFDGNGKITVELREIDLTTRDTTDQYSLSESEKLTTEMRRGVIQAVISDEGFYEFANTGTDKDNNVFLDMTSEFPEFALYKGCGIRLSSVLSQNDELPDNLILYIRAELPDYNNSKKAAQYRSEAMTLVRAIAEKGTAEAIPFAAG